MGEIMTEPYYAKVFGDEEPFILDPDEIEYVDMNLRPAKRPALADGENIDDIVSAVPTAHAAGLGLEVLANPAPALVGTDVVRVWVKIADAEKTSTAWDDEGTRVGIEITVDTTAGRRLQNTGLIDVAHK